MVDSAGSSPLLHASRGFVPARCGCASESDCPHDLRLQCKKNPAFHARDDEVRSSASENLFRQFQPQARYKPGNPSPREYPRHGAIVAWMDVNARCVWCDPATSHPVFLLRGISLTWHFSP